MDGSGKARQDRADYVFANRAPPAELVTPGGAQRRLRPMAMVWPTALDVEGYAAGGKDLQVPRLSCPTCRRPMSYWGWYRRVLRVGGADHRLLVRRLRCRASARSHAVLPEFVTWGRLDEVVTIGGAISAMVRGTSGLRVAQALGLAYTTVRDWGRRWADRAELVGAGFCSVVVALGDLVPVLAGRPAVVAVAATEAAWRSARRRLGDRVGSQWRFANAVVGSHLISTNMDPPWAIA